jgi:hypothetical protein
MSKCYAFQTNLGVVQSEPRERAMEIIDRTISMGINSRTALLDSDPGCIGVSISAEQRISRLDGAAKGNGEVMLSIILHVIVNDMASLALSMLFIVKFIMK